MEGYLLFSASGSMQLAQEVAYELKLKDRFLSLSDINLTRFADDEFKVKSAVSARRQHIFVIASTNPPSENIWELFMIIDSLRRASAESITVIIPYYGYARQDRKSGGREPITAKMFAKLLESLGVNRVVCIDLHADQIQGFFDIPADNLHTHLLFANALKSDFPDGFDDLVIVSPDTGGLTRARFLSRIMKGSIIAYCDKERDQINPDSIIDSELKGKVAGKKAIIYDDVTSTFHSLLTAMEQIKDAGATEISIAVMHYACSKAVTDMIVQKQLPVKKIYTTNTNPRSEYAFQQGLVTLISVAGLISDTIIKIAEGGSVSELFLQKQD